MKPNEIVRDIMKLRGFSNQSLATKLNKSTASAISNPLSREKGMRVDTFIEMVEAMDCGVIVRSTLKDKTEWQVNYGLSQEEVKFNSDELLSDPEPAEKPKHVLRRTGRARIKSK